MNSNKIHFGQLFTIAGVLIAFYVGAGFATGQEVLQYYAAYGGQLFLAVLVFFVLFTYALWSFGHAAYESNLQKGNDIFYWYCGRYIGRFFDYFTVFFLYLVVFIMYSGAASTGQEEFGWAPWVGICIMAVLVTITALLGLNKLVDILGRLGPVIVLLIIFVGVYTVIHDGANITAGMEAIRNGEVEVTRVGSNFFASGYSNVGFCMLMFAPFVAELALTKGHLEIKWGILLATTSIALTMVFLSLAFVANIYDVALLEIPTLALSTLISPALSKVFSVVIFAGIYTTTVPIVWMVVARFAKEGSKRSRVLTILLSGIAAVISLLIPHSSLVNAIYGFGGYLGGILIFFLLYKDIRGFIKKRFSVSQHSNN